MVIHAVTETPGDLSSLSASSKIDFSASRATFVPQAENDTPKQLPP
jgi:hypothetical protein